MQNFLLAQAVVEHSVLSSIASGISEGTYQVQAFVADMNVTQIAISLAIVVFLMFWWKR